MTARQFVKSVYPEAVTEYFISPSFAYNGKSWYTVYTHPLMMKDRKPITGRCDTASSSWKHAKNAIKNLNT